MSYTIRTYQPADAPHIMALQERYAHRYPGAVVIPAEVYASPAFAGGENIFCAFSESGTLLAYAPLYPALVEAITADPHTFWIEIKADPFTAESQTIKDWLLEAILARARKILQPLPPHPARLVFQYLPCEVEAIAYAQSRGFLHLTSLFQMKRDLSLPIPDLPQPAGVQIRSWRMESEAEQRAYIEARNAAFPENPGSLEDWQYFLQSPLWAVGTTFTAFAGDQIAGSAAVYWNEAENRVTGLAVGSTEYIFVLPPWQRRGIASFLIVNGMRFLKANGLAEARLEVRAANAGALNLYQSLGYQIIQESQLYEISVG